jgi:hypothetical protein
MTDRMKNKLLVFFCILYLYSPDFIHAQERVFESCGGSISFTSIYTHDCRNGFKYPSFGKQEYEKLIKAVQSTNLILKAYKDGLISVVDLKLNTHFRKDVIFICAFHMKNESPSPKLRFYPLLVSPVN